MCDNQNAGFPIAGLIWKVAVLYLGIECWRELSEYWLRAWLWAQDLIRLILALLPCFALHLVPFLLRSKSCSSCDPFLLRWCSTDSSRGLKITMPDRKKIHWAWELFFFLLTHSTFWFAADIWMFEHSRFQFLSATVRGRSNLFAKKPHILMQSHGPRNWSSASGNDQFFSDPLKKF